MRRWTIWFINAPEPEHPFIMVGQLTTSKGNNVTVKWRAFEFDGKNYDLTHVHPITVRFEHVAGGGKPAEIFNVDVIFTCHCFTRDPKPDEIYDEKLIYPDDYEKRLFDVCRYELSKRLPDIIRGLPNSKPRQNSGDQKFFVVEISAKDGEKTEYEIYFKIRKVGKGKLQMIVESAFIRDPEHQSSRPNGRPISFWIILHNTLHGLRIRR